MIQVAAVQSQTDALALAQALQLKKFPAFVIPPGADKFYRVQSGTLRGLSVGRNRAARTRSTRLQIHHQALSDFLGS